MKKAFLTAVVFLSATFLFAQSEKYKAAMTKNLADLESSFSSQANLVSMANNFERIALAEKNQWLPYYYAAFCQVNSGFIEPDKSKWDGIADRAAALIAKADSLAPANSEVACIKSMIASCHMMVDPQQRWQEYGQESSQQLAAAMQQDPSNPRPYYLKGQGLMYTPEEFGGGCKTASVELKIAMEKYQAFKPATDLHPTWGKKQVDDLVKQCGDK